MSWASSLALSFDAVKRTTTQGASIDKTRLYHRKHTGALMVQRALYPEPSVQQGICHILMLYPPAGIAGGDTLTIDLRLDQGSHAVITTPGAGKWYGKDSKLPANTVTDEMATYASQDVQAELAADTRLEWLPQESIIYNEANMHATSRFDLADSSSLLTWEISVFGRQAYDEQFLQGRYHTGLRIYREGKVVVAERVDQSAQSRWFTSNLGLASHHIYGSFWAVPSLSDVHDNHVLSASQPTQSDETAQAATKQALTRYLDHTIATLRQVIAQAELPVYCTHNSQAVNIRYIGSDVRDCFEAFYQLREILREHWWQLEHCRPRIWDT
ncbi:urease accessory protein UreD [Psychrobacter sp. PP-21]|uniref:urease accessory protein UreD n=1 Tax=Psychrobacter sp. PP-21 TaxID=2957503 RepID=UPI0029A3A137|nr:urease accessory protein UreD [Psychrobacter sp. PP-21]MDX2373689.1 urease accessory protein UreD [Psychrobacter sp. PP-21]